MYENCKIINPKISHEYTLILLHPMQCSCNYFDNFIEFLNNQDKYKNLLNIVKFIFPQSPIMDIDFPSNKLTNQYSWYNYYSCYNNKNKIDNINIDHYENQTLRIKNIIKNEVQILKKYNKIFLGGISQGGTLIFNVLKSLPYNIGGLICIKSILMYKYTKLNEKYKNTPIYIFIAEKDDIYNLTLQKSCLNILKNNKLDYYTNFYPNLDHYSISNNEQEFIANILLNKT